MAAMFDDCLLDSSPSRMPVLSPIHWLISLVVGIVTSLVVFFGLPVVLVPPETKVLIAQSAILGALALGFALMLCYVFADSRHLGLSGWFWVAFTVVFNLVGFVIYLIYCMAVGNILIAVEIMFLTILYVYASEGVVPAGIDAKLLKKIWRVN